MLSPVAKKRKKSEDQTLIFNYLAVTLPARWRLAAAHNQARRLTAGPAARDYRLYHRMVLGHRRRSIRRAAAAGGSGRALRARPDLRLPGSGQDKVSIRAEG